MSKTFSLAPICFTGGKKSTVDVVCYYADFGLPYREHVIRHARSIKRVMPEARSILLTPNAVDLSPYFNHVIVTETPAKWETLMADRTLAHIRWAIGTERRTIFCDCDLEILKPPQFDGFDVGVLWRGRDRTDMPICASMVLMEPNLMEFNRLWAEIVVNIAEPVKQWWCDQISLSLITGVTHKKGDLLLIEDARVKLLDYALCADREEKVTEETWALHRKGSEKGKWFVDLMRGKIGHGAGMSLQGSASSTVTSAVPSLA